MTGSTAECESSLERRDSLEAAEEAEQGAGVHGARDVEALGALGVAAGGVRAAAPTVVTLLPTSSGRAG